MPKQIRICLDGKIEGDLLGRVFDGNGRVGAFRNINGMTMLVEGVFDRLCRPEKSTEYRTFGSPPQEEGNRIEKAGAMNRTEEKKEPDQGKMIGEKATFLVQICYRQNATWQGKVVWAEKNQTKQFRSALELIKLIDSAVEECEG